jgi:hypothetical protein
MLACKMSISSFAKKGVLTAIKKVFSLVYKTDILIQFAALAYRKKIFSRLLHFKLSRRNV